MDPQTIWIMIHVVLLVYWLGADISVFYCSLQIIKPANSRETRAAIAKVLGFVNAFPGIVSILMLPVGLMLASGKGLSPITGGWLALVWGLAAIWLLISVSAASQRGTPLGKTYATIDLWIRYVLIAVLTIAALLSLTGGAPFTSNWLALKVLLFAFVLVCGLGIRFTFAKFGPAFGRFMAEGSTPETEAGLRGPVMRVKPWVLALWSGLVVMALLGIAQPLL
ncbi:MAG: hypothetical protein O3C65_05025 [Proteobacteria bacterium]|nr:hypothetical protein [Pseudomonadota bacterium]MDA1058031.1 hypothetical protein [Pseudomonadota bacterium]